MSKDLGVKTTVKVLGQDLTRDEAEKLCRALMKELNIRETPPGPRVRGSERPPWIYPSDGPTIPSQFTDAIGAAAATKLDIELLQVAM